MSHRHVCVHGHFYQPPRENPWTGAVEREESAAPFHDWNARVAEECYGPITLGVRAGLDGRTIAYDETLKRLSFNFGPTLLSWIERERPSLLTRILAADGAAQAAIAQPYFHSILPLETRRDKETLVRWGRAEFRRRYGRDARGMWLPETAVDDETLEVLAAEGIAFTILDPKQASAVRPVGADAWTDVDADSIDPKTPYLWISPKNPAARLAIFFYHRRLSHGVVTGETLASAAGFADAVRARILPGEAAQLVHVASDGEFYGHHRPGTERVLALGLDVLEAEGISPIHHGRFLALFPPPREVKLRQDTAWSCEHGLGRWKSDCGCRSAHLPQWKQDWRGPLREALTRLAHRLDAFYEDEASRYFDDPWKVRDESIALWLDAVRTSSAASVPGLPRPALAPADETEGTFLATRAKRVLLAEDESRAMRLLVLQRERLAMFTSCGWFFDDISGVESVLCLQRAARALDLARSLGEDAEESFVERLGACRSNLPRFKDGGQVWRRLVAATRVGLDRAAAHAAILDHLELPAPETPSLRWEAGPSLRAGKAGLAGRNSTLSIMSVRVRRPQTREAAAFNAVVHRADRLDFACWIIPIGELLEPAAIREDFLRLSDEDFRAALDAGFSASRGSAARFGLDALLSDERAEVVKALSSEGALGTSRAAFLKRWIECVSALRRGAHEDDAALELLAEAPAHSFSPAELPWAAALTERLYARLAAVAAAPNDAALASRALRWLDALWDADLLAGTWRLRDVQQRWSSALAGSGPSAALEACRALGARLGQSEDAQ